MEASSSFTPLGSIQPPGPSLLLPGACNPVMDLVTLVTTPSHIPLTGKGKQKAGDERRISLWRVSGSRVWDVGYEGTLLGLAWSADGLYLSVLLRDIYRGDAVWKIRHISVHDGTTVHDTILDARRLMDGLSSDAGDAFWQLEWSLSDAEWPVPEKGTARMIIDLLPRVTPVEEPKPSNPMLLKLMEQQKKHKPKGPIWHVALATFPRLLPTFTQTRPQILSVVPPRANRERRLLSGIYPISNVPQDQTLVLAGIAHRMSDYLDAVLRGLENAELAFKEGAKQTMIWREELETCGEQQGLSIRDAHSDLFRFLLTGRCNPALTEWLGNRLTGRVVSKWESTLDESYRDIHKLLVESVQPALERIILLIDEVKGLAQTPGWTVDPISFTQGLDKAKGLAFLLERIRRLAKSQRQAAEEWFKWIHFEITRATASDQSNDNLPPATHDVKLVWAFMKQGFVDPPLFKHFPSNPDSAVLPSEAWALKAETSRDLDTVLPDTMAKLGETSHPQTPTLAAVATWTPGVDDSVDSSHIVSSVQDSPAGSRRSSASSPDTVEKRQPVEEHPRYPAEEPLVWAKELVNDCATLFKLEAEAPAGNIARLASRHPDSNVWASREVSGVIWTAYAEPKSNRVYIGCGSMGVDDSMSFAAFRLPQLWLCETGAFFDDVDLVLVLHAGDERRLVTVSYADMGSYMVKVPDDWTTDRLDSLVGVKSVQELPISRSRALDSVRVPTPFTLAVNGRVGRRIACVTTGGDVSVFDMDEDEDAEDDEAEQEDEHMEED